MVSRAHAPIEGRVLAGVGEDERGRLLRVLRDCADTLEGRKG